MPSQDLAWLCAAEHLGRHWGDIYGAIRTLDIATPIGGAIGIMVLMLDRITRVSLGWNMEELVNP
ncbi:hypothetical protein [Rhizobium leguminosarum]|uniref:hypothetical protein n=1 Tax=Rhizobium leguminosarum TaxID=384 RepID=UPI0003178B3F|nr:hypothetical protein [Rhizobium leguminosarum]